MIAHNICKLKICFQIFFHSSIIFYKSLTFTDNKSRDTVPLGHGLYLGILYWILCPRDLFWFCTLSFVAFIRTFTLPTIASCSFCESESCCVISSLNLVSRTAFMSFCCFWLDCALGCSAARFCDCIFACRHFSFFLRPLVLKLSCFYSTSICALFAGNYITYNYIKINK